jgi:hypothetical protein
MSAKLYKWKDEKGNIHYGQTKPTEYESAEVNKPPPPPANAPDLNKPFAEQIRGKNQGDQTKPDTAQMDPGTKASQCAKARNNLTNLQNNSRVRVKNPDGSVRLLTDDEKQDKLKESQKQIDYYCN